MCLWLTKKGFKGNQRGLLKFSTFIFWIKVVLGEGLEYSLLTV